jgi:hypothetical protein
VYKRQACSLKATVTIESRVVPRSLLRPASANEDRISVSTATSLAVAVTRGKGVTGAGVERGAQLAIASKAIAM